MKNVFKNIKNNPMTIIFAFLGAVIMGFSAYKIAPVYLVELPAWAYIVIACAVALLTIAFVILLGWDNAKSAILRAAKKNLDAEGYDKVIAFVGELENQQKAAKEQEVAEAAKQVEIEKARKKVEEYEQAKKLLEQAELQNNQSAGNESQPNA